MTTKNTPAKAPAKPVAAKAEAKKIVPKAAPKAPVAATKTVAKKATPKIPAAAKTEVKKIAAKPPKTPTKPHSKVIRDSFTFPESDYRKISELKKICLDLGVHAKKSEILRAGLQLLASLDKAKLKDTIGRVEKMKTGRPVGSESVQKKAKKV